MKKLLLVNACVNRDKSRTQRLSNELISLLIKKENLEVNELILEEENIKPITSSILNKRVRLLEKEDYSDEMFQYARKFANADYIVVAAPYWDLGFPAILKIYIESVSIPGVVYKYGESGRPVGLCKAIKIYYITTRGGYIGNNKDLGFATIEQLAGFYGIKETKCIGVDGFDIPTNDVESILENAINDLPKSI